jgi:hypothetical protein
MTRACHLAYMLKMKSFIGKYENTRQHRNMRLGPKYGVKVCSGFEDAQDSDSKDHAYSIRSR